MRDYLMTDLFGVPDQPTDEAGSPEDDARGLWPEPWPDARAESPEDDDCRPWEDEEPQGAGGLDERIDDAEACCEWEADRRNDRDRDEDIMHRDREGD